MRGRSSFLFFSRAVMPAQTFQLRRFLLLYTAELARGQYESNPVFQLATRAGKMALSSMLGIYRVGLARLLLGH